MTTLNHESDLSFVNINQIVEDRLTAESGLNIDLPDGGFLYMDRPLPFILVYRYKEKDPFIEGLISAEASGLAVHEKYLLETQSILRYIAETLSEKFGAFMIIEMWPNSSYHSNPEFKIYNSEKKSPSTFHFLKDHLEKVVSSPPYSVELISSPKRGREEVQPLFATEELKKMEALYIALEIPAFYRNPESRAMYPLVARELKRNMSRVLQKTFFEFIKVQTVHEAKNFQMLGRRNIQQEVWEIDSRLAEINEVYDFLLLVSPINGREAWDSFKKNGYRKNPHFQYRMIPVDPETYKKKLFNIPIEEVEDPTLSYLFRDKRAEIEKLLTMLESRNTEEFLYSSLQVYGGVKKDLLNIARGLLTIYPVNSEEDDSDIQNGEEKISKEAFIEQAKAEMSALKAQYDAVKISVREKPNVTGLMVSRGALIIGGDVGRFSARRARALIQHEIGTHVLTYYNGKAQPLKLLYTGAPGYEELQEGLAVLSEYLVNGLTKNRLQVLAARVLAVNALIKGYDFVNTFQMLIDEYNLNEYTAFILTMRVFRGGGLTKDAVYLRGFVHLLDYIKQGNDIKSLLIGKIRQDYLSIVRELLSRKILKPMPLMPRYLTDPFCLERLKTIATSSSIFNLI